MVALAADRDAADETTRPQETAWLTEGHPLSRRGRHALTSSRCPPLPRLRPRLWGDDEPVWPIGCRSFILANVGMVCGRFRDGRWHWRRHRHSRHQLGSKMASAPEVSVVPSMAILFAFVLLVLLVLVLLLLVLNTVPIVSRHPSRCNRLKHRVFYARGILLDVAVLRKTERLPIGYVITTEDVRGCLDAAKLKIEPGDVGLIRTGHGRWWMKDNKTFHEGEPGVGLAAAKWLSEQKIVLLGSDNWAIEVVPNEDKEQSMPVHQWNLVRHGIYHLENLDLDQLAADKVYEFAFIFAPLRLKGATGSPGNPIAVR